MPRATADTRARARSGKPAVRRARPARPPSPRSEAPAGLAGLTHLDARGKARMVDVSAKPDTVREARARVTLRLQPATLRAIRRGVAIRAWPVHVRRAFLDARLQHRGALARLAGRQLRRVALGSLGGDDDRVGEPLGAAVLVQDLVGPRPARAFDGDLHELALQLLLGQPRRPSGARRPRRPPRCRARRCCGAGTRSSPARAAAGTRRAAARTPAARA